MEVMDKWIPNNFVNSMNEVNKLTEEVALSLNDGKPIPKLSKIEMQALIFGGSPLLFVLAANDMSISEFVERANFKGF